MLEDVAVVVMMVYLMISKKQLPHGLACFLTSILMITINKSKEFETPDFY